MEVQESYFADHAAVWGVFHVPGRASLLRKPASMPWNAVHELGDRPSVTTADNPTDAYRKIMQDFESRVALAAPPGAMVGALPWSLAGSKLLCALSSQVAKGKSCLLWGELRANTRSGSSSCAECSRMCKT